MNSKISSGVMVSVETFFQPEYSNPANSEFMFAYRITITNNNHFPVRLLRRHWHITDSNGVEREVEGEGVVGIQPLIKPQDSYQYISGCNLHTEMGKMHGHYVLENLHTRTTFNVMIPVFHMVAPFKLN
jgi:ApaG protein